ncbi:alpha/beta fold hydrolase [Streptomyces sp. NPDC049881]|uniref:alpha/beta fold hydrolase n=1 Tax=Streptomyces sp. NPDC049881 TaxID=3155778 RepID=UPI00342A1B6F
MTPCRQHTFRPRPGLALPVRDAGTGSPVLVLHGGPGPDSVTPLVEHLAARHRVLAPTHPGWDGTPRPGGLDSVTALAAVHLDLLAGLDLRGVTVVGTSFGGWAAARMAVGDRDGRISRLVLIDAIGPDIPGQAVTPPAGRLPALDAYTGRGMRDPELLPALAAVTYPVLVLWGAEDKVVTPDFGAAYAAAFPDGRFVLVPGAGHLPIREEPEAVLTALDAFLAAP